MFNQENSQFLNNYNQQFEGPITLDNPLHNIANGIVSKIISNNISLIKTLKNKLNSTNSYINLNNNFPQIQYNNQISNQNSSINMQGELDESNLIDMMKNISLEPSNPNRNNISSLGQSLYGVKIPLNMTSSLNPQTQKAYIDGGISHNSHNNSTMSNINVF